MHPPDLQCEGEIGYARDILLTSGFMFVDEPLEAPKKHERELLEELLEGDERL